ncbi:MAG TPA: hypothetical protein VK927_03665, partial [Adhaeribacter sp.]|nr:hypothetical protein [Adhaeribacter sp.]
ETTGYIKKLRDDRKIDVSLQKAGFAEIQDASSVILQKLKSSGGTLPLSDSSIPEEIYQLLGMSKKTFKKAIGTLYRNGRIRLHNSSIELIDEAGE